MGILFDRTTGYWTIKATVDGKDKRVKLRKIEPDEPRRPIPDDVIALAGQHSGQTPVQTLNEKLHDKLPPPTEPTPLIPWLDRYAARYRRDRRRASIVNMDRVVYLLKWFAKEHGIKTLNEITEETIDDYVNWRYMHKDKRIGKTVGISSIVAELGYMSGIFSSAVRLKRIMVNPVSIVAREQRAKLPGDKPPKYLDPEQLTLFLSNLDKLEANGRIPADYADLARVMLYTGIRVTACMNMRYEWIDVDYRVNIPAEWDKATTGYAAVIAPLGRKVIERRRLAGDGTGRVFPGIDRVDSVQHYLAKLKITPHQLRHSFGTACVDSDVSIQIISDLMGHHDIKTTMIYAKVRDKTKLHAADKIVFGVPGND